MKIGRGRRLPRWWAGLALATLLALPLTAPGDLPGPPTLAGIHAASGHDRFNLAVWEMVHVLDLLPQRVSADGDSTVAQYFQLAGNLRATDASIRQGLAVAGTVEAINLSELLTERERVRDEMGRLAPLAQRELQDAIGQVLYEQGFTLSIPFVGDLLFPPVAFTFSDLPRVLIVSPRDEISIMKTVPIRSDITEREIEALEASLERRGLSAIVEPIGGLATYPALVKPDTSHRSALAIIAHEWVHHYLFFRPLGQGYGANGQVAAINETVANIVGNEVAALALGERPPVLEAPPPPPPPSAAPPPPEDSNIFSASRFLRETRIEAESLLAEGRADQAESYMEERRRELVREGVYIRKLNQAYFAFYGAYTDGPAAGVSPIYAQLVQVRLASSDIGDFLRRVENVRTPADLEALAQDSAANPLPLPRLSLTPSDPLLPEAIALHVVPVL
jgi:hypothetical protein